MAEADDNHNVGRLIEAVTKLTVTTERAGASLANIEALFVDMLRRQAEDRIEFKERQKKSDEEFKQQQKKWDEHESRNQNKWFQSLQDIAGLLLLVALAAMAIAVVILASR